MSDYISKQVTMQRFLKEIEQCRSDCIHINTIKRLLDDVDTLDEKEIIRKPFERVVEKLCDLQPFLTADGQYVSLYEVVQTIKEECGINE